MYDIEDLRDILMPVVANMPEPESKRFAFDDGQGMTYRIASVSKIREGVKNGYKTGLRKKPSDTSSRSY